MRIRASLPLVVLLVAGCHHHRQKVSNLPQQGGGDQTAQPAQAAPPALAATDSGAALTRVTADNMDETTPQLSPDRKVLIFVAWSQVDDGNGGTVAQTSVLGADPSNGTARTVYTNANAGANWPTFMPNGALVYASMTTGTQALVRTLTNAPNAAFTVIADGRSAPSPSWPAVSPEGKRLAFEATMNNAETIVTSGMDGSKLTILGAGVGPSWSPDGKRLAFSRTVGNASEIMLMDAGTGANLTQVTNSGCNSSGPKFSPDGRYLVFASNCGWNALSGGGETTTWNIFAVKPDGSSLTQLTSGIGESGQPFWGKDGWIYFESNYGGTSNRDIWRLQPTGDLAGPAVTVTPAAPTSSVAAPPPPGVPQKSPAPPGTAAPTKSAPGMGSHSTPAPGKSSPPKW